MNLNFTVRKANKKDVKIILFFIKTLATYEKAPNKVTITENELLEDGFSSTPLFHCLLAEDFEKNPLGMALYYDRYSTWKGKSIHLEDLIVLKKYRNQGIGFSLFKEVAKSAYLLGVKCFQWEVLDWNSSAIDFYKQLGAELDPEWILCKMYQKELKTLFFNNNADS